MDEFRMKNHFSILATIILCQGTLTTYAQETPVAFDSAGNVFVIDRNAESKLGLFTEFADFQSASMRRGSDSVVAIEVQYTQNETAVVSRRVLTNEQLLLCRQQYDEAARASLSGGTRHDFHSSTTLSPAIWLSLNAGIVGGRSTMSLLGAELSTTLSAVGFLSARASSLSTIRAGDEPIDRGSEFGILYGIQWTGSSGTLWLAGGPGLLDPSVAQKDNRVYYGTSYRNKDETYFGIAVEAGYMTSGSSLAAGFKFYGNLNLVSPCAGFAVSLSLGKLR